MWPVSSPAIPNGAVLVDAAGHILEVGPEARIPKPPAFQELSAPDALLLPGLINAHTHLELTEFRDAIPESDFFEWIQHVRRRKEKVPPDAYLEAARCGVREAWAAGITTVADTGDSGAVARALTELGGRGIAYQEVFGPNPDQAEGSLRGLRESVTRLEAGSSVRIGVSPHAPYSVSGALYRRVVEFARAESLPLATHLAESREETAFLTARTGPFADLWRRRGLPFPPLARSPVGYLEGMGVLGPRTLVIHAVHTDGEDRRILAEAGCAVALCPRSNARHGHGAPPIAAYLQAGGPVALGTDSVASVGSLDLFAEARAAHALAPLDAPTLIRLLTLDAARALGMQDEIGSLEPGKWADFCLLKVPARREPADRVLEAQSSDVVATWVAGRLVAGGLE